MIFNVKMTKVELKTKLNESSVEGFLNGVEDEERRADCFRVLELMKKVTGEGPKMWGPSIVGFGSTHLKYESGRELDWMLAGFSPRKANLTLYIMSGFSGTRVDARLANINRPIVSYIKNLSDVDRIYSKTCRVLDRYSNVGPSLERKSPSFEPRNTPYNPSYIFPGDSLCSTNDLILDFGSQYTQLIARRVREQGVYCEIHPFHLPVDEIIRKNPKGIILSGGPSSVTDEDAPRVANDFCDKLGAPILGICYGMQLLAVDLGGTSEPAARREYGHAKLKVLSGKTELFRELPFELDVWMSHGDHVTSLPEGFHVTATTGEVVTAIENTARSIYAVQFHPEVSHTPLGKEILRNFLFEICGCRATGPPRSLSAKRSRRSRRLSATAKILSAGSPEGSIRRSRPCSFSRRWGLGNVHLRQYGLLRADEFEHTLALYKEHLHLNVRGVDALPTLLGARGCFRSRKKRKIIGGKFIDVFESEARKIGNAKWLCRARSTRCDRIGLGPRRFGYDQVASQRRRPARKNGPKVDRAPARAV